MENKQTKKEADSQPTESNSNGGMAAGSNHQEGAGWAGNAGCRSCRMRLLCILSVLCLSGGRIRSKVRQMVAQNRERRARTGMQGLRLEGRLLEEMNEASRMKRGEMVSWEQSRWENQLAEVENEEEMKNKMMMMMMMMMKKKMKMKKKKKKEMMMMMTDDD
ncbi:predicted protein [Histoplasma capsulatum G186AR]|uniref:Uncharacterized protein n=1 Tax=Ajellomyces capsulatus (strain G186AR / H82 / ATCC MYA-2454 / RMSCC 2432) TaxID=447093 RepID=C0NUS6_AJECG|nr:uncharacterized protein HCBG_06690 [Histoplasma capsulatum G186AR]EEH04739.1 predicted protein [Histoplasma capsulatum G186AR]